MKRDGFCLVCEDPRHHACAVCCRRCQDLVERVETRVGLAFSAGTIREALRRSWDGEARCFRCEYTGIKLSDVQHHPAELVFDHAGPTKSDGLRITARLINCIKTTLSEAEFYELVPALASVLAGEGDRDALEKLVYAHVQRGRTPTAEDCETPDSQGS